MLTVAEIKKLASSADAQQLAALEKALEDDARLGVQRILAQTRSRIEAEQAEAKRLQDMYDFQAEMAESRASSVVVGLDEAGRGPLAGPLAVGAVILPPEPQIAGMNDSKQIQEKARAAIADEIKELAIAWSVAFVDADKIDEIGMSKSLRLAFSSALSDIEAQVDSVDLVLIDGNPLHFDPREVNIVKGDAKCACIAAASIIAKTERDSLMEKLDAAYPQYGFARNKGYGTSEHREAIHTYGLTDIHRRSFCTEYIQQSLF